jgi:hypothetical protein
MLQLAYGKPAVFFACCSRAESFAQAFGLPFVFGPDRKRLPAWEIRWAIERLFDPESFARVPEHYAQCRGEMIRFLEANGLEHKLGGRSASEGSKSAA